MAAREPEPERETVKREMRVSRISIRDYKAIESLELDLPPPKTDDEPDAFVLGSKNGMGKTSVLEACAIGLMGAAYVGTQDKMIANPSNAFVRSGAGISTIATSLRCDGSIYETEIRMSRGGFHVRPPDVHLASISAFTKRTLKDERLHDVDYWLPLILGLGTDPLVAPPVLLFHSYRKVREGNLAIEAMVDANRLMRKATRERSESPGVLGTFKALLVRALMARSGLFEGVDADADEVLEKLNALMQRFAQGRVDKLRPYPDGTYEIRVEPVDGGPSYSFDGLSSGQKEVITTLFLIWHTTRESPSVVLIDEPELHLNAEWQRLFIHTLWSLAPWNQYIMATHSEDVFGSVTADRRILLNRE